MKSLREFYRIGHGPSSSHTMGPQKASVIFRDRNPEAASFEVTLFGSLAATGKGHLTDRIITDTIGKDRLKLVWKPETVMEFHPNCMLFRALDAGGNETDRWEIYSVGGGELREAGRSTVSDNIYPSVSMTEILGSIEKSGKQFWQYVEENEDGEIWSFLEDCWKAMQDSILRGIENEGSLPGGLNLPRKAASFYTKSRNLNERLTANGLVFAYALAVSEENAAGGKIVTAPTCGSAGVLPAVLYLMQTSNKISDRKILHALATAGLFGNIVKSNASISGAEVGCQGEIGTACAMAAAAVCQLMGGTPRQIEYAAEMGLEHHLGMTCDPVLGLVQIPCIERNAIAASRAVDCAIYSSLSDGSHRVSFDEVTETMYVTGKDMNSNYRETSIGGLARISRKNTISDKS